MKTPFARLAIANGTVATNMLPMCHSIKDSPLNDIGCNNSKWKHDPIEWVTRKYDDIEAARIITRIKTYFQWVQEQDK